jgi:hypothetical protein
MFVALGLLSCGMSEQDGAAKKKAPPGVPEEPLAGFDPESLDHDQIGRHLGSPGLRAERDRQDEVGQPE